jgi:hypothetical protein
MKFMLLMMTDEKGRGGFARRRDRQHRRAAHGYQPPRRGFVPHSSPSRLSRARCTSA